MAFKDLPPEVVNTDRPTGPVIEYRSPTTADRRFGVRGRISAWLRSKIICFPQRTAQLVILAAGWLCAGTALSLPAFDGAPSSVWGALLFAVSATQLDLRCITVTLSTLGTVLVAPVAVLIRRPQSIAVQTVIVLALSAIWLPRILDLGRLPPVGYHLGFYIEAVGCIVASGAVSLSLSGRREGTGPMWWSIPLAPLLHLELPRVYRHSEPLEAGAVSSFTPLTSKFIAYERRAIWSAAIVLCCVGIPCAFEYVRRASGSNGGEWGALGIFLLLSPVLMIFSLIGLVCAFGALAQRPRRIPALLAGLVCIGTLPMIRGC